MHVHVQNDGRGVLTRGSQGMPGPLCLLEVGGVDARGGTRSAGQFQPSGGIVSEDPKRLMLCRHKRNGTHGGRPGPSLNSR
ncbi:Uncharacterised protein [Mycobacteroides abscessus subsp. abscessus]|nr:Uncharacterised protein [Mycobacteroides abscessus subsp. abscessus]